MRVVGMNSYARTSVLHEVRRLLNEGSEKVLEKTSRLLHERFKHYSWVGLYLVEGEELVLRTYSGNAVTSHTRIPIGTGICGAAAESGRTIMVPDVSKDPRYLMCFRETKSEIVVPLILGGKVLGEIDIDSNYADAFTQQDQELLESVARLLAEAFYKRRL